MNVKYYPHLVALVMVVGWLSFGNGCRWEEPVEVGSVPAPLVATTTTIIEAAPVLQAAEVTEVECEPVDYGAGFDWWAVAYYPGLSAIDLLAIHTMARHKTPFGAVRYLQMDAHIGNGVVWVRCGAAFDMVYFAL